MLLGHTQRRMICLLYTSFNGDIGRITSINSYTETVEVEYEEKKKVNYPFQLLDELELAYAITIHKSQGSEYPAVVIPLCLLYTSYNEENGITPQTVKKSVRDLISISKKVAAEELRLEKDPESMSEKELEKLIKDVTKQMKKAAAELNFEAAAELRDKLIELKKQLQDMEG